MEKTYCIYCLINRVDGKKYVGMTSQTLNNRWRNGKGYRGCEAIEQAINKFGWENFDHEVLKTGLSFEEACEAEKNYIISIGSRYPQGYNIDGGGVKNRDFADRTKEKIRAYHIGKKASAETRAKQSAIRKGRQVSEETRKKLSEAKKGVRFSEIHKQHISEGKKKLLQENISLKEKTDKRLKSYAKNKQKPVLQYTKDGDFVARHESMRSAAESVGGKHPNIFKCCAGIKKSMYGFVWKYEEKDPSAYLAKEVI